MTDRISLTPYLAELERIRPLRWTGEVTQVAGLLVESRGPAVAIGDFCEIRAANGRRIRMQTIGFRDGRVLSMPLEEIDGLQLGDTVAARSDDARVEVGPGLLGRVIDGFGKPMDDGPAIEAQDAYSLHGSPVSPLAREHITEPLTTGIRAIDALLPCGKGQRIGIFGGSGVGKSTLLGCMSRHNSADVTVIGHSHLPIAIGEGELVGGHAGSGVEVELDGRWLLNPGSVGQPRDGDPDAAWLLLDLQARHASFRRAVFASQGGSRNASAAISICTSESAPAAEMMASYFACSAESMSKSASGSA